MKTLTAALVGLISSLAIFGQGTVHFNTRIPGLVDARFMCSDGLGLGAGFTAQLFGGTEGTPLDRLEPLYPTTTFRTSSVATLGYVNPVDVTVPGVAPGDRAVLLMRAYRGPSWEQATFRMQSNPITITLGGGLLPPANLVGMNGTTIIGGGGCIPEPSTVALWVLGLTLMVFGSRKKGALIGLAGLISSLAVCGQGTIHFNNRVPGLVDARVLMPDGSGAGAGVTAQLYGGPEGTPINLLQPLLPTTTFRTSSAAAMGYVKPVDVTLPGVPPGGRATVVMIAYFTGLPQPACFSLYSNPITITLGGGILPPANLIGLQPLIPAIGGGGGGASQGTLSLCVPEPGTVSLCLLGLLAILFLRRR